MFKKLLIVGMAVGSLSLMAPTFADEVSVSVGAGEGHWWHHPDLYQSDFEEWYPAHKEVWSGYYKEHKDHYSTFCEKHHGWTFCE